MGVYVVRMGLCGGLKKLRVVISNPKNWPCVWKDRARAMNYEHHVGFVA